MFEEAGTSGSTVGSTLPGSTLPGSTLPGSTPAAEHGAVLSSPLALLLQAVVALRAQAPVAMPGPQALSEAAVLLRELEKLQTVVLTRLADVERRGLHSLAAAPTTSSWVAQQQTGLDRGAVALARRLGRLPLLSESLETGTLPVASASRVAAALAKVGPFLDRADGLLDGQPAEPVLEAVITLGVPDLVAEAFGGLHESAPELLALRTRVSEIYGESVPAATRLEAAFVTLAQHLEPQLLDSGLARLVDALLPQRLEERAQRAHDNRGLTLTPLPDGSGWTISKGELDLETGELLWTVLQAEMATDPDGPADTAAAAALRGDEQGGPLPFSACTGVRSLRQRRHDALRLALRRYLDSGVAGLRAKVAPHLSVTVSLDALHGQPGVLLATSAAGTTLPTSLVRRWACDSALTRVVLGVGRRVVELSHTARTATAHERRIKQIETGGRCQGAGCARGPGGAGGPGAPLVPHHAVPWSLSGRTALADTVMLCGQTHHDLHEGGRTIRLKDGRYLSPTGWVERPGR